MYKKLKNQLEGPVFTIFTPFKKNLKIDYFKLKKYINFLYLKGARNFYVMPYNSRYSQLTEKEIFNLNKFCIKHIKKHSGTLAIVSDVIHGPTSLKMKYCYHAKKNGADIFASICREKYYSDDQIFLHYKELNKVGIPILIHEMPFLSGYDAKNMDWPVNIFKKISKLKRVIAIKEDSRNIQLSKNFLKKFEPRFRVIVAARKEIIFKLFKFGLKSYLNGSSLVDPRIGIKFWYLLNNNYPKAKRFYQELDNYFWENIAKKFGWHRVNKYTLEFFGLMRAYERLPMIELTYKEKKTLKKKLRIFKERVKKFLINEN